MDFVVVGFGLGALGVLLGVVMLGLLAPRSQRAAMRAASPHDAAHDLAVAAEHRGTGQAFFYAGAAMLLATVGGLAGALDDRTGALLVTTTATVAVIGILLGGYLHRVRNPAPPRRGARPAAAAAPSDVPDTPPATAPSLLADDAPTVAAEDGVMAERSAEDGSVTPLLVVDPGTEAAVEDTASAPPPASNEPASGARRGSGGRRVRRSRRPPRRFTAVPARRRRKPVVGTLDVRSPGIVGSAA